MAEITPAQYPVGSPTPPVPTAEPFFSNRREGGLDLRAVFDILLRGKWIILVTALALAIPITITSLLSPSRYRSYSVLLIDKQDQDLADVLPSSPGAAFFRSERNLSNELLVLRQSMPLALSVAEKLMQIRTIPGTDRPLTILNWEDPDSEITPLSVAFRLQNQYLAVGLEGGDADAVRISAVSTDPAEAELITNTFSQTFVELTQSESRAGMSSSREFLEEQVSDKGEELRDRDAAVRDYMLQDGAMALGDEASRLVNRIAELDAQKGSAEVRLRTQRAQLDVLQSQLRRLEPQLTNQVASGLDAQLETARARVTQLEGRLQPFYAANPDYRSGVNVPEAVATLQRELEREQARVRDISERLSRQSIASGSGPGDYQSGFARAAALRVQIDEARVAIEGLQAEISQVSSSIGQYEAQLGRVPRQSIELAQLQRERQSAELLYGALEQNLQQARVAEQSQLGYAQVIRPAYAASRPFSPRRAINILLGLMAGLVFGAVLAVAKVRLDHKLYTPDDIRDLGVPLIGTIPSMTEIIKAEHNGVDTADVGGRKVDTHLVSLLNPMASASEAYRALRTSVQFSRPDVVVETILVTSANPSEGKSTTAANLGVVMAQSGRRVLLVDGDLRKPTVHRKLGLPREPGLVQHIFDDQPIDLNTLPQIADDLYVLTAGSIVPNPSELLGSKRMREVIDGLRAQFDVIIFDAPPVLAATDAVLLSTQCDATVVVSRAGQTKDYDLDTALESLGEVGAKVIGVVLNGFDVTRAYGYAYKYAYRYGNDYAYGSDKA